MGVGGFVISSPLLKTFIPTAAALFAALLRTPVYVIGTQQQVFCGRYYHNDFLSYICVIRKKKPAQDVAEMRGKNWSSERSCGEMRPPFGSAQPFYLLRLWREGKTF